MSILAIICVCIAAFIAIKAIRTASWTWQSIAICVVLVLLAIFFLQLAGVWGSIAGAKV